MSLCFLVSTYSKAIKTTTTWLTPYTEFLTSQSRWAFTSSLLLQLLSIIKDLGLDRIWPQGNSNSLFLVMADPNLHLRVRLSTCRSGMSALTIKKIFPLSAKVSKDLKEQLEADGSRTQHHHLPMPSRTLLSTMSLSFQTTSVQEKKKCSNNKSKEISHRPGNRKIIWGFRNRKSQTMKY